MTLTLLPCLLLMFRLYAVFPGTQVKEAWCDSKKKGVTAVEHARKWWHQKK
jgi:hypothetical protein